MMYWRDVEMKDGKKRNKESIYCESSGMNEVVSSRSSGPWRMWELELEKNNLDLGVVRAPAQHNTARSERKQLQQLQLQQTRSFPDSAKTVLATLEVEARYHFVPLSAKQTR